jgi:hypothetical protein
MSVRSSFSVRIFGTQQSPANHEICHTEPPLELQIAKRSNDETVEKRSISPRDPSLSYERA